MCLLMDVGEMAGATGARGDGFRARNKRGENIVDFTDTHDLTLINT